MSDKTKTLLVARCPLFYIYWFSIVIAHNYRSVLQLSLNDIFTLFVIQHCTKTKKRARKRPTGLVWYGLDDLSIRLVQVK